jgi:hypothetical protein
VGGGGQGQIAPAPASTRGGVSGQISARIKERPASARSRVAMGAPPLASARSARGSSRRDTAPPSAPPAPPNRHSASRAGTDILGDEMTPESPKNDLGRDGRLFKYPEWDEVPPPTMPPYHHLTPPNPVCYVKPTLPNPICHLASHARARSLSLAHTHTYTWLYFCVCGDDDGWRAGLVRGPALLAWAPQSPLPLESLLRGPWLLRGPRLLRVGRGRLSLASEPPTPLL